MPHDALLTSTEASVLLGKSVRTVQRMAEAGELRPVRKLPGPNGAWLFDRAEVETLAGPARASA